VFKELRSTLLTLIRKFCHKGKLIFQFHYILGLQYKLTTQMHADHHCSVFKQVSMNYFAKTVYYIAKKLVL